MKSHVEEWKTTRKVKKLEHRADQAENYAGTAIFLALAAEEATLSAICSRLDAEAAAAAAKK